LNELLGENMPDETTGCKRGLYRPEVGQPGAAPEAARPARFAAIAHKRDWAAELCGATPMGIGARETVAEEGARIGEKARLLRSSTLDALFCRA
jgi:hypothetical protein